MKKILLLLVCAASVMTAWAQPETTLPFLRRLNQSSFINPAFTPEYERSVGVPVFSNIFLNVNMQGIDAGSVTKSVSNQNLDLNKLYDNINTGSIGVHTYTQLDLFQIRFPVGKFSMGLNASNKVQVLTDIDKDFFGFLVNGNGYYKGKSVDLAGVRTDVMAYTEIGVSLQREFEKFSIGGRVKYLQGIANASTNNLTATFTTPQNSFDPIRVQMSGSVNTSGLPVLFDSINGRKTTDDEKEFHSSDLYSMQNHGWAVDLGMSWWVTPRLNVHASVADLGMIYWNNRTYNYGYNNIDVSFGGLNYDQLNNEDARKAYTDSLQNLFKNPQAKSNAYTTMLATKYYLGADYDLTLRDRFGFLAQGQYFNKALRPAVTLAYTRRFGTNWDVTTNYSYVNGSFVNLGLGTAVKWGAFQIYFVQDNVLLYMIPDKARSVYLRLGFNLVWGAVPRKVRI